MTPAERWLLLHDDVLRGLNHALSNRIGTVGALAAVLEPRANDPLADSLALESRRLEEILALLRLLPAAPGESAEPLRVGDVVANAIALNAHRAEATECACEITWREEPPPVLTARTAVTHALLMLIASAADEAAGAPVQVHERHDTQRVTLWVSASDAPWSARADVREAMSWLLRHDDANAADANGRTELVVESLAAARARQR